MSERIEAEFTVTAMDPTDWRPEVTTGVPVGEARMTKVFTGRVEGRSETRFLHAYDEGTVTGTYLALESFEGSIDGRRGTLAFWHVGTTVGGADQGRPTGAVVPASGTGDLTGLTGTVAIRVDEDGSHHLVLDLVRAGADRHAAEG